MARMKTLTSCRIKRASREHRNLVESSAAGALPGQDSSKSTRRHQGKCCEAINLLNPTRHLSTTEEPFLSEEPRSETDLAPEIEKLGMD